MLYGETGDNKRSTKCLLSIQVNRNVFFFFVFLLVSINALDVVRCSDSPSRRLAWTSPSAFPDTRLPFAHLLRRLLPSLVSARPREAWAPAEVAEMSPCGPCKSPAIDEEDAEHVSNNLAEYRDYSVLFSYSVSINSIVT